MSAESSNINIELRNHKNVELHTCARKCESTHRGVNFHFVPGIGQFPPFGQKSMSPN